MSDILADYNIVSVPVVATLSAVPKYDRPVSLLPLSDPCPWIGVTGVGTKHFFLYRDHGAFDMSKKHGKRLTSNTEVARRCLDRLITETHGVRVEIRQDDFSGEKRIQWVGILKWSDVGLVVVGTVVTQLETPICVVPLDGDYVLIEHSQQQCVRGRGYVRRIGG